MASGAVMMIELVAASAWIMPGGAAAGWLLVPAVCVASGGAIGPCAGGAAALGNAGKGALKPPGASDGRGLCAPPP